MAIDLRIQEDWIKLAWSVVEDEEADVDIQKQMASAYLSGVADWNAQGSPNMPKQTGYKGDADYIREMAEAGELNAILEAGQSQKEQLDKTRSAIDELYEWVEKAVGPTEMAAAKQKGLVPQSGNWQSPKKWVKPKKDEMQPTKERDQEVVTQRDRSIEEFLFDFQRGKITYDKAYFTLLGFGIESEKAKELLQKKTPPATAKPAKKRKVSTHDKIINSSPEVASLFAKARDYDWNFDYELSDSFTDREDDTDAFLRRFGFQDQMGDHGTESVASTVRNALASWTEADSSAYMSVRGALHKLMGEGEDRTAKEFQFWTEQVGASQRYFDLYYGSSEDSLFHKKLIPFVAKSREYLRRKFPSGNITVYRGVSGKLAVQIQQSIKEKGIAEIPNDGISSYSLSRDVADNFAALGEYEGDSDEQFTEGAILQKTVSIDSVLMYFDIFNKDFNEEEILLDSDFVKSFTKDEIAFHDYAEELENDDW